MNCLTLLPESMERMEAEWSILSFLDPMQTGVADEILALLSQGILCINEEKRLRLSDDWYVHVDCLVLDEMESSWGSAMDPVGRYGVSDTIRMSLAKNWTRQGTKWIIDSQAVHDSAGMKEWRDTFENKKENYDCNVQGIGLFGI
jgi:hypothetical protein